MLPAGLPTTLEIGEMMRLGSQPLDTPSELSRLEQEAAPRPPTVLVVDDDRAVRDVLSAVLRDEGYPVRQAPSADEALELLRGDGTVPLVLCDMKMPEHDGLWLLDQIIQRHPQAAVVMLTGYGDTQSPADSLNPRPPPYLLHPPQLT